jgi:hypothetical protein
MLLLNQLWSSKGCELPGRIRAELMALAASGRQLTRPNPAHRTI